MFTGEELNFIHSKSAFREFLSHLNDKELHAFREILTYICDLTPAEITFM